MKPIEDFSLTEDPIFGGPIEPPEPRKPLDPTPSKSDPLTVKNGKALIRRHQKGGGTNAG